MNIDSLARRCSRDHERVVVEGKYTKASASYTGDLAMQLAMCFKEAAMMRRAALQDDAPNVSSGLENQLVNLVAQNGTWKKVDAWTFLQNDT